MSEVCVHKRGCVGMRCGRCDEDMSSEEVIVVAAPFI